MPAGVRFLPNAITVLALCAGLSSIALAHREQWFLAAAIIGAAAVLDSLDGPAARLLHSSSRIGAELDSLSDCVSFGVAPAVVMYLWGLDRHPFGWLICLVYATCTTLRLARFNSLLDDDNPKPYAKGFFTGIPSTGGGLLAILPMALYTRFGDGWWTNDWLVGFWLLVVAALMISRLPTIALKSVYFPTALVMPALIALVICVAIAFYQPVIMFALGVLVYLAHLPYASWKYRHLRKHPELWYESRRPARARARSNRLRPRVPVRRVAGRAGQARRVALERYRQRGAGNGSTPPAAAGPTGSAGPAAGPPAADQGAAAGDRRQPRRLGRRRPQ